MMVTLLGLTVLLLGSQVTPRGVQLQLVGGGGEVVGDTLVMSNLGYFQLKAYPGVFQLQLAPGRTRQLYSVQSSTGVTEDAQAQVSPLDFHSLPDFMQHALLSSICLP